MYIPGRMTILYTENLTRKLDLGVVHKPHGQGGGFSVLKIVALKNNGYAESPCGFKGVSSNVHVCPFGGRGQNTQTIGHMVCERPLTVFFYK